MAESGQSRGILTALRAAAILVIATGLNDVIGGALPRYEPLYLYLAAVALVVLLDGVILGALTALAALAFYALLFMPRAQALSAALLEPLGAAFATVLVMGIVRGLLRGRRRAAPSETFPQTLLAPAPAAIDNTEVITAIDELRQELRAAVAELAAAGDSREALIVRARIAEEENARLSRLVDAERAEREHLEVAARNFESMTRDRNADLHEETEERARVLAAAREESEANARALARAREESGNNARALASAREEAASYARALADARGEATLLAERVTMLESGRSEAEASARQRLDTARAESVVLRSEVGRLRGAVEASHAEILTRSGDVSALRTAAEELRVAAQRERARADEEHALREGADARLAELERAVTAERAARNSEDASLRDRAAHAARSLADERKLRARLEADAATRDAETETLRAALVAARDTRDRLEAELQGLADQAGAQRARMAALEQALTVERDTRDRLQVELQSQKAEADTLRTRVARLAQDHKGDVGKAIDERDEAQAEARGLTLRFLALGEELRRAHADGDAHKADAAMLRIRIEELEQALAAARLQLDERVQTMTSRLAQERDADVGKARQERESARAEALALTARVHALEEVLTRARADSDAHRKEASTLRMRIEELQEALDTARLDSDAKLQTITTQLAHDHEADVGEAIEAREAARAEARALTLRVHALEETLTRADVDSAAHSAEALQARLRIEELEQTLGRANAEFDEKLATIARHLAEDHETDLGKAMVDKEGARAEVRNLTMRLSALQQVLDEERQVATERVRETDERHRRALEEACLLAETGAAEIDQERAGVAGIEPAQPEQPPWPVLPDGAVRPRVLIAHADADLRISTRASLERAGYEILSAADGLEALRIANAEHVDAVIADAVMPRMDGRELCQLLKSQEKTAHVRVILFTRATEEQHKGDIPPDGILHKPVPLEMLKSTLAALLSRN